MWKGRGRVLILASRGPGDVGEEDLQPLPAVDILDAAPTVERRVDMVAGGDEDGFAVDRHLSTALDDIIEFVEGAQLRVGQIVKMHPLARPDRDVVDKKVRRRCGVAEVKEPHRSEEHTSELQSLMRISYAVFCLKKKHTTTTSSTQKKT